MFGIGSTELLVILVVALVILGPKSLPGIAKTLGKVMGEFRRVSTEFQRTMNAEVAQDEHEKLKKEAEEELFGNKDDDANTAKSKSSAKNEDTVKDTKSEQEQEQYPEQEQAKPHLAEQNEMATESIDGVQAENNDAQGQELNLESPLAQAVAKAEVEANNSDTPKENITKG